jgi:hypothetical protein
MTNYIEDLSKAFEQYRDEDYVKKLTGDTISRVVVRLSAIYSYVSDLKVEAVEEFDYADENADFAEKELILKYGVTMSDTKAKAKARVETHQNRMEAIRLKKVSKRLEGLLNSVEKLTTGLQSRLKNLKTDDNMTQGQND